MKTPWSFKSQEDCVKSLGTSAYFTGGECLQCYFNQTYRIYLKYSGRGAYANLP